MTKNQIAYHTLLETQRANRVNEAETRRANEAKEAENTRSNTAKEQENYRHNTTVEKETERHNSWQHGIGVSDSIAKHVSSAGAILRGLGSIIPG